MQKELNPELFGEKIEVRVTATPTPHGAYAGGLTTSPLDVERQIVDVKAQMKQMHEYMHKMAMQVNDFIKVSQTKMERLNQAIARNEQVHTAFSSETNLKMAQQASKISERRAMDIKIQEMVDRQNQVLRSFEARMSQLQRVLSEKDAQIMAYQASLNEAKMEIAKLKKL